MPAADVAKIRALLRPYLDQRILFYMDQGGTARRQMGARTVEPQAQLWASVLGPAAAQPTPTMAWSNDVLNAQGYTQAAWWNRIPTSAWAMLAVIAVCCSTMVGYSSRSAMAGGKLLTDFPLFVAIAFGFIADIDSPRHGIIRVHSQDLMSLAQSLPAQ